MSRRREKLVAAADFVICVANVGFYVGVGAHWWNLVAGVFSGLMGVVMLAI